MTIEPFEILAISLPKVFWNLGATLLFLMGLFLILVILIQDSQGGGLGGAFGGGGGDSLLGARAQKGISKFTAILGIIFALFVMGLGRFNPGQDITRPGDETSTPPTVETVGDAEAAPPGAGAASDGSGAKTGDGSGTQGPSKSQGGPSEGKDSSP